jgi:hypothetical protein
MGCHSGHRGRCSIHGLPPATDPQTVEEVAPPLVGQVIREMEADDRAKLLGDGSDEGRELCMKALHGLPEATLVIMERLACRVLELEDAMAAGRMPAPPERSPNGICLNVRALFQR